MSTAEAIESLVVGNSDFDAIERSLVVFCPFEAMGMIRQEVRHAFFLAHCIDPQRPHGFGSDCLRALIRASARAQRQVRDSGVDGGITPLDVHLMNLDGAIVEREWRRIDILVVVPEERLVAAIELKIDSREHSGQLGRYRAAVAGNWPVADGWRHLFLFLTKGGDDASEDDGAGWLPVELEAVATEFDEVVRRQVGSAQARDLLASYLQMLRRHHLQNEQLEELAAKLWSQHHEALAFLADRRPGRDGGAFGLLYERRDEVAAAMSAAAGTAIALDDSTRTNLRFAIPVLDEVTDMKSGRGWTASNRILLIEMAPSGDRRAIRIRFVIGSGDSGARRRVYARLEAAGLGKTQRKEISDTWTRLDTETLVRDLDKNEIEPEKIFARLTKAAAGYARKFVPSYVEALSDT